MSESSWEKKVLKAVEGIPVVPIVLVIVAVMTMLVHKFILNKPKGGNGKDWTKEIDATSKGKKKYGGSNMSSTSTGPLRNIWEERKQNGSTEAEQRLQKTDSDGKPFGSSYYYAHNNLRRTGGYTDGLRMEDYQMETPRLLSKNGVRVSTPSESTAASNDAASSTSVDPTRPSEKRVGITPSYVPITKYLWDDPGDHKGIGTIRIDQLADNLSWQDADVTDIKLDLKDETALTVLVEVKNSKLYRLHIPKLYGRVEVVKKVAKSNRLLIRLFKRNKDASSGVLDSNNIKAWPTPHKKGI